MIFKLSQNHNDRIKKSQMMRFLFRENTEVDSSCIRKLMPFISLMKIVLAVIIFQSCASLQSSRYQSRVRAVDKVHDENILYMTVMEDKSYYVKFAAMARLPQYLLEEVCSQTTEEKLKVMATKFINDQDLLIKLATENTSEEVRRTAAGKLNLNSLITLLLSEEKWEFLEEAFSRLDNNAIESVLLNTKNWDVRRYALNKLPVSTLRSLISKTNDEALITAIKVRTGDTTWADLFSEVDNSKSSLSLIIGASSLVDQPIPPTAYVIEVCHNFIRLGDETRVPELRYLLLQYGDESLAEDYLNCGKIELYEAGVEWGRLRGRPVIDGFGSARVRWGETGNGNK